MFVTSKEVSPQQVKRESSPQQSNYIICSDKKLHLLDYTGRVVHAFVSTHGGSVAVAVDAPTYG